MTLLMHVYEIDVFEDKKIATILYRKSFTTLKEAEDNVTAKNNEFVARYNRSRYTLSYHTESQVSAILPGYRYNDQVIMPK